MAPRWLKVVKRASERGRTRGGGGEEKDKGERRIG